MRYAGIRISPDRWPSRPGPTASSSRAPFPHAPQLRHGGHEMPPDLAVRQIACPLPRDNDDIGAPEGIRVRPEELPHDPLYPIPLRRLSGRSRDYEPQPALGIPARQPTYRDRPRGCPRTSPPDRIELLRPRKPRRFRKTKGHAHAVTLIRFRPFLLLRERTFRPPFFRILARNPCLFLLFRLLG